MVSISSLAPTKCSLQGTDWYKQMRIDEGVKNGNVILLHNPEQMKTAVKELLGLVSRKY
jgi:hypothetical protein